MQNWQLKRDSVQSFWNEFEDIVDRLAPFQPITQIEKDKSNAPPPHIKNKINKRNRLLKKLNKNPNNLEPKLEIKQLNKEIKHFFTQKKFNGSKGYPSRQFKDSLGCGKDSQRPEYTNPS